MSDTADVPRPRLLPGGQVWSDLALTLPIFVAYHLGVVLLRVRNAADVVTVELTRLAEAHILLYWGLTLAIGAGVVVLFTLFGKREAFDSSRFALVALEGVLYAFLMRLAAARAVGALPLAAHVDPRVSGVVMSMGAGFYEELAFRVGLFGGGTIAIGLFLGTIPKWTMTLAWAVAVSFLFSAWHYVGPMADAFRLDTFVFRAVCGLCLTAIFAFRGFAAAVWTHTLYDLWAMVLR